MKTLGKYEIINKLGEGTFGEVYLAKDTSLKQEVALKVLKSAWMSNPFMIKRFLTEAQSAAQLFHQNIATIFEFGESGGRLFIAMQYVEGDSLKDSITKKS
jgi:eukaryotic-like serine/threonine-protein kinase